jgi:hypothetical protein
MKKNQVTFPNINSKTGLRQKIREALGKFSLAVRTVFPHLPMAPASFSFAA